MTGTEHHEQDLITEGHVEKELCTGEHLSTITGLQLCGTLSYPNATMQESAPFYPLTGPLTAAITLDKTDDFTAYMFEASFLNDMVSFFISFFLDCHCLKIYVTKNHKLGCKDGKMNVKFNVKNIVRLGHRSTDIFQFCGLG